MLTVKKKQIQRRNICGICEESREVRTGARARVVASKVCVHLVIYLKGSLSTFMQKEIALEVASHAFIFRNIMEICTIVEGAAHHISHS